MAETLEVQLRDTLGTRNTRRLRQSGSIPAVLYGPDLVFELGKGHALVQRGAALGQRAADAAEPAGAFDRRSPAPGAR